MSNDDVHNAALLVLTSLAQTDNNSLVQAAAISTLGRLKASGNMNIFKQALNSQSYAVQGAALNAVALLDPAQAMTAAKGFEKDNKGALTEAMLKVYSTNGGDAEWPFVKNAYEGLGPQGKFDSIQSFTSFIGRVNNPQYAQQGIDILKGLGVKYKKYGVGSYVTGMLDGVKTGRKKLNDEASAKAADDAIKAVNDAK
jgi:aminopeptidase N